MIAPNFTEEFLHSFRRLTWWELLIGLREGWLDAGTVSMLAAERLAEGEEDPVVVEVAGLTGQELSQAQALLETLARRETSSEEAGRLTWMRLLLIWLYRNREGHSDPLAIVEQIYADFGYPDEIRHLVRYNEPAAGTTGSTESIHDGWKVYVEGLSSHL